MNVPEWQLNAASRVASRSVIDIGTGCHMSTMSKTLNGYARVVCYGHGMFLAHRIALATSDGIDITSVGPQTMALHSCDRRACVNPSHLRWGNASDNMQDKVQRGRDHNAAKKVCPRGHAFVGANLISSYNKRACRVCSRARSAMSNARTRHGVNISFDDAIASVLAKGDDVARDAIYSDQPLAVDVPLLAKK